MPSKASRRGTSTIRKQAGIWEQLLELKAVTLLAGTIHEAQSLQLKLWGRLAFSHVHDVEIAVGLPYLEGEPGKEKLVDQHVVEFRLTGMFRRPPANLKKRCQVLAKSLADMLGDVFSVKVVADGTVIFSAKGKPTKKQDLRTLTKRLTNDRDRPRA